MIPFLLCILLTASTAFAEADTRVGDPVLAHVNGTTITESRVRAKMKPVLDRLQRSQPGALDDPLQKKIRDKAIDLLVEEAVVLTSQRARALPNAEQLAETPELVIPEIRRSLATECAPCTEEEARAQYATNTKRYLSEGRVKVSMIRLEPGTIETDNLKRFAVAVQNRVGEANDEEWNTVAAEYSSGPKAGTGGHWDWCAPSELPDELGRFALSLHRGEVARCVRDDVYYVLRLNDSEAPRQLDFEDARPRIEAELMRMKAAKAWRIWLAEEMSKAQIRRIE